MMPLLIILIIGLTITLFLGWRAVHHHSRSRAISGTPLTTVKQMTDGPTRLEGQAVALGPLLTSPVTGTPCLYFKLVVEEEREFVESRPLAGSLAANPRNRGRTQTNVRKQWVTIAEDTRQTQCGLDDETGVAEVELFDAELTLIGKESRQKGLINQCSDEVRREIAENYGLLTGGMAAAFFGKKTRYTESLLLPGEHLLVTGQGKIRPKRRPAIGKGERSSLIVSNRGEAETLGHHAWRRAGAGLGAVGVAALTVFLAIYVSRTHQEPMMGDVPAPAPLVTVNVPGVDPAPAIPNQPSNAGKAKDAPPASPESRIDRDLRELRSSNTVQRTFATRRLRDDYKTPVEDRRAEVAAALMDRMNEGEGDFDAAQALVIWATPKELAQVLKFLGHRSLSKPSMAILGRFQVVAEAGNIASFLKTDRKEAAEALIAMGPGAESAVLPFLNDPDNGIRREVCYILQRIGSAPSLAVLDSLGLDSDGGVAQAAQLAARTIRKRDNLPDPATVATGPAEAAGVPSAEWAGWAGDWSITGQKKFVHGSGVQSLAYGPSGKILATGDGSAVRVWDVTSAQPKERGSLLKPKATAKDLLFLADEKTLVLGMDDNSLRLLDVSGAKLADRQRLDDQKGDILALTLSPDRKTLAVGSDDMSILLYDVSDGSPRQKEILKVLNAGAGVKWLGFLPEGETLISITGSGDVRRWDLSTDPAREVARAKVKAGSALPAADLSPDGRTLAIADDDNRSVHLWSVTPRGFVPRHTWKNFVQKEIGVLAWSPRGPILAAADLTGRVILWNTEIRSKVLDKQTLGEFRLAAFAPTTGKPTDPPRLRLAVASRKDKGEVTLLELAPNKH